MFKDLENSEIKEYVVYVGRKTKVVKGGRNFSIAVLVVVGDHQGSVGFGLGKAKEVADARRKAAHAARRSMKAFPVGRTVPHKISASFGAASVIIRSAPPGTGLIAGGAMRDIFNALGVRDVVAKAVGSTNPHSLIRATFAALQAFASPEQVAERRGISVDYLLSQVN
jgi:small subunit ribosomal protein S5